MKLGMSASLLLLVWVATPSFLDENLILNLEIIREVTFLSIAFRYPKEHCFVRSFQGIAPLSF